MTFMWLVAWLISHTPQVQMFSTWNNWGVALGVCLAIDLMGSLSANAWRQRPLDTPDWGDLGEDEVGWFRHKGESGSKPREPVQQL